MGRSWVVMLAIAGSRQRRGGSGSPSASRSNQATVEPSTPARASRAATEDSTVPRSSPTTSALARAASSASRPSMASAS